MSLEQARREWSHRGRVLAQSDWAAKYAEPLLAIAEAAKAACDNARVRASYEHAMLLKALDRLGK